MREQKNDDRGDTNMMCYSKPLH